MSFQKIPHKERMRHIKYRDEQWERREEREIRKMIAEMEALKCGEPDHASDKEREVMEMVKRLQAIVSSTK